jgi:hypothetical protein
MAIWSEASLWLQASCEAGSAILDRHLPTVLCAGGRFVHAV